MSGKLDQSLDDIVSTRRTAGRGRGRGRRVSARAPLTGGVQKTKATGKPATAKAAAAPAAVTGSDTKIIVSNLPADVNEAQIKEYFAKQVGLIARTTLQYNANGTSRGIATVIFKKPGMANKAAAELNGLLVDKRPMKIELVVDSTRASEHKSMGDRVTKARAKDAPKPAAGKKTAETTTGSTRGSGRPVRGDRGRGRGRGGRNAGRPKPKSSEELDAEMTDYFGTGTNTEGAPATNGAAPAAAGNDDTGMDEIS